MKPKARVKALLGVAVICALLSGCGSSASELIPEPNGKTIVDATGTLSSATLQRVDADLVSFSDRTDYQLAILLVGTTDGQSIEDFSNDAFNKWGVGDAKSDKGVMVVLALDDRKGRIEVGFGAEGVLTDVQAKRILDTQVFPRLRSGDPDSAVVAGEQAIRSTLGDTQAATPDSVTPTTDENSSVINPWIALVFIGFLTLSIFGRGRGRGPGFFTGMVIGGSSGWGGGGGGGFGGFGGGSSGGGGASGSW